MSPVPSPDLRFVTITLDDTKENITKLFHTNILEHALFQFYFFLSLWLRYTCFLSWFLNGVIYTGKSCILRFLITRNNLVVTIETLAPPVMNIIIGKHPLTQAFTPLRMNARIRYECTLVKKGKK